jgi:predicted DsbA family dithiol-disulfide isomerase
VRIDIWSDIVCPWCYIGKRRFEKALAQFPQRDQVEVVWHSFQLDPSATETDVPLTELLASKYGVSREQAEAMNANVTQLAKAEGLDYHLDKARHGNTFDAHRLLHLAADRGRQPEVMERFLQGYFAEGEPVGDPETLVRLAASAGLADDEVREVLVGTAYAAAVEADLAQARAYGINGVPFFVLDARLGVSGAQSSALFSDALAQAWSSRVEPLTVVGGGTDAACEGDSCAV